MKRRSSDCARDDRPAGDPGSPPLVLCVSVRGMAVPEILLSGNHPAIARWRREQSLARSRPPDPSRGCLPPRSPGSENPTTVKKGTDNDHAEPTASPGGEGGV